MGKTICGPVRTLILKVLHFFEQEKLRGISIPVSQVEKRVCAATGIGRSTLSRIKREEQKVLQNRRLSQDDPLTLAPAPAPAPAPQPDKSYWSMLLPQPGTSSETPTQTVPAVPLPVELPTPGKKRINRKKLEIDDLMISAIKYKIERFYSVKKELPTLRKLLASIKTELNFPGQRTTLRSILTEKLGYQLKKSSKEGKGDVLLEKPEIAGWRAHYLRRLKENDDLGIEKKPVIFTGVRKNHFAGQRWIIIHAGGENGFVEGAELLYNCRSTEKDYQDELDKNNYTKWLTEQLIPNLPSKSIVVIDNGQYHCKLWNKSPSMASRKEKMQNGLTVRNIADIVLTQSGHEALILPPYHCDLSPIHYIWNIMKQRIADKNEKQSESNMERLTREAIQSITQADWKKETDHVDQLRQMYWEKEGLEDTRNVRDNVGNKLVTQTPMVVMN